MSDSVLGDPGLILVLIKAIIKKNGGKFVLSAKDIEAVKSDDLLFMKGNEQQDEFTFYVNEIENSETLKKQVKETLSFGKKEIKYEN